MRQQKFKAMKTMAAIRFFWLLLASSCYTFRLIPYSETELAQRTTNFGAAPHGRRTFLDEDPLISAIKRDYHLHDPTVAQQVKPKGIWSSMRDYITQKWRPFMSSERDFYHETSGEVRHEASNMQIQKLARRVRFLGLAPVEYDIVEGIRVPAHLKPQPVIYMALAALEQNDLPLRERVWALGALAGLENYWSSIKEGGLKNDIYRGPLSRGELELSLVQNRIPTESVEKLWNGSGLSDTVLQEALSRVELIQKMKAEIETDRTPGTSQGFISIYDWLLSLGSAPLDDNVESVLRRCQEHIKEQGIPTHEKELTTNVIKHFHKYNSHARALVVRFLVDDRTFQLNFHGLSAQKTILDIFSKLELKSELQKIFEPFKDLQNLQNSKDMPNAMNAFEKLENEPKAELALYKIMSAAGSAHQDFQVALLTRLETSGNFRLHVIKIWNEIFPNLYLNLRQVPSLSFENILFVRAPELLRAARREILMQKPQFAGNTLLRNIKSEMEYLPLKPENGHDQSESLWQRIIAGLKNENEPQETNGPQNENKKLEQMKTRILIYEAFAQFLSYQPSYKVKLLEAIKNDEALRKELLDLSKKISHASSPAAELPSDIAKHYAKRLLEIIALATEPKGEGLVYLY